MQDLNKFSSETGKIRLINANKDLLNGQMHDYESCNELLRNAQKLPHKNKEEKEIRSDAIKLARIKKEASSLINKYGIENIVVPDNNIKSEIMNRDAANFIESLKIRHELKAYLKIESIYNRATKPYRDAENLIAQASNYSNYEKLEEKYHIIKGEKAHDQ